MKKCKYCKSEIDEKAKICPNCRKRQDNIKLIIILGIIIIITLLITITIPIIKDSKKSVTKNLQKSANTLFSGEVLLFNNNIFYDCVTLENIANDIRSYWRDSIYEDKYNGDINNAIAQALEDNEEDIKTVKNNKKNITESYNKIRYLECYSIYCDDIKEAVKNIYNSYLDFYNLATSPSGNYTNYSNNFSSVDTETVKYFNDINDLLNLFDKK